MPLDNRIQLAEDFLREADADNLRLPGCLGCDEGRPIGLARIDLTAVFAPDLRHAGEIVVQIAFDASTADLPEVIAGRETTKFRTCGVVLFLGIGEPGQKVFMMCPQGGCDAVPGLFG